jgi:hypothetical protein
MGVSGQVYAMAVSSSGKLWLIGWVGSRVGLNAVKKRKACQGRLTRKGDTPLTEIFPLLA